MTILLGLVGCTGATEEPFEAPTSTPTSAPPTDAPTAVPPTDAPTTVPPTPTQSDEVKAPGDLVRSDVERVMAPDVEESELNEQVTGNSAFAFDLYRAVREDKDNLFYSPHSITLALAMAYAGARGETEAQMAQALHYRLSQERLHPAFNALDLTLSRRGEAEEGEQEEGERFQLNIANAVWGQADYPFRPDYLDVLARNYGAGLRVVNFESAPEEARQTINQWVSEETEGKIEDLLPQGAVDTLTRLILTNAIYFNASWMHPFEEKNTSDGTFYTLNSGEVTAPMMKQTERFGYAEGEGYQAVELPYVGNEMSMVIMLPAAERFDQFEGSLDAERVRAITEQIERQNVTLTMPKFEFESKFGLADTLAGMGMSDAFSPEKADFSGIDGTENLFITDVVHKAFVSVDEAGTEAAAATGVVMGVTSAPAEPVEVTVDHPFIFLIRDVETGAILFVGRVLNPEAQGG
jgi:serpin B